MTNDSLIEQAQYLVREIEKLRGNFVKCLPPVPQREVIHHKTYVELEDLLLKAKAHEKSLVSLGSHIKEACDMLAPLIQKEKP